MRRILGVVVTALAVLSGAVLMPAKAAKDETFLVSMAGAFGPGGDSFSGNAAISADGRFVAFVSSAGNLAVNDNDAVANVYVRDLVSKTMTLASLPSGTDGTGNTGGSTLKTPPGGSISADGRFVAFQSTSDNLATNDNDAVTNVYVRDLAAQTTTLASLPTGTDGTGNNSNSSNATISADGRFVAFQSTSNNLAANDNDAFINIYVRDLVSGTTTLASLPTGTEGLGNNSDSINATISADGRFVAFQSNSGNLATNDNDAFTGIYVRDLVAETTTLASLPTGTDGTGNNGTSFRASISADGRFATFESNSDNLATNDNDAELNIYVRDLVSETTTLASLPTGSDGTGNNGGSFDPSISADGRFVAFQSTSDNLATNDNDAEVNIYVRDVVAETTTLVSLPTGTDGTGNNGDSFSNAISADGRFVAFTSDSDNLATNDTDGSFDVFVRDVLGPQPLPALSIDDAKGKEGRKGTTPFTFTVHLDGVPPTPVTVDYVTIDRSAKSPSDYVFTNGTLTFAPGEHTKEIVVEVVGDKKKEKNEVFLVRLQNASGAPISDDRATGRIRNDDRRK